MNPNIDAKTELSQYLARYHKRLKSVLVARGTAVVAGLFLVVSLIAAYLAVRTGFASDTIIYGRLAILLVALGGIFALFVLPLRALKKQIASKIEESTPEFDGRIQTLVGASSDNPMQQLLAEDAWAIAQQNSPKSRVSAWDISIPSLLTVCMLAVLLICLVAAPGLMNYSLRHLYAGWMVDDLLPPQSITVTPGDELVRRGASLHVEAAASGFQPGEASLYVLMESGEWQEVSMNPAPDSDSGERSFDFTLFSVRESMSYYVKAMGIRSPTHTVDVVDLPGIKNLEVTYEYPEWTGLEPQTLEQGGDIDALPGTGIRLAVTTDTPLPAGELVLNGETLSMDISGEQGAAGFTVEEDGEYFLAARIGSEQVRLSDNYFIRVLEDQRPEIEFASPGRDSNATSIEEIATTIQVEDDYVLENVELRYAVNGGEWNTVALETEDRIASLDHVFYLEEIVADAEVFSAGSIEDSGESEEGVSVDEPTVTELVPGDLISYYAVAEDRASKTQTDIYFIEVQPFDRRVSPAEQGGGLGGGQGASEQEISQRQKEIVVSIWNLIREQSENTRSDVGVDDVLVESRINDNALLLSRLQLSLQEQAQSLLETARARGIDDDERVGTFVEHMERAIEVMTGVSESLAEMDLDAAIQPGQEALQHLSRADAVVDDIEVSLNQRQGGGGGGGGGAGQDLAEMMELEIDFDQNQYETGSQASRDSQEQQTDDAMRELEELARRQEQLADSIDRNRQPTQAQEWQQEILRRDAEALRERLNQLERNASAQSQQSQQGQAGQDGEGQAGQGGEGQAAASSEQASSEVNRRLESALEAMERATEAMRTGDTAQLEQAADEARRQLEGAGSQIAADLDASVQEGFADMADRAAALYRDQARLEETLLDGVQRAISSAPEEATTVENPFDYEEENGFAEDKRAMIAELQRLKEEMQVNADRIRAEAPNVSRMLDQADAELKESEIAIRMDIAANYFARGESLYVANSESMVTRSLEELKETLEDAERLLSGAAGDETALDRLLSDIREGSGALRELAGGNQGEQNSDAQSGTAGEGQAVGESQTAGQGQTPGSGEQAATEANSEGNPEGQGQGDAQGQGQGQQGQGQLAGGPNGTWNGWGGGAPSGAIGDAETQIDQLNAGIGNLVPELRARGVGENQIAEVRRLVEQLQNAGLSGGVSSRAELNDTLALLEKLEQTVDDSFNANDGRVRSQTPARVQIEYQEAVAEYYRRLSADADEGASLN